MNLPEPPVDLIAHVVSAGGASESNSSSGGGELSSARATAGDNGDDAGAGATVPTGDSSGASSGSTQPGKSLDDGAARSSRAQPSPGLHRSVSDPPAVRAQQRVDPTPATAPCTPVKSKDFPRWAPMSVAQTQQ